MGDFPSVVAEASAVAEVPDRLVVRCGAFGAELARGWRADSLGLWCGFWPVGAIGFSYRNMLCYNMRIKRAIVTF